MAKRREWSLFVFGNYKHRKHFRHGIDNKDYIINNSRIRTILFEKRDFSPGVYQVKSSSESYDVKCVLNFNSLIYLFNTLIFNVSHKVVLVVISFKQHKNNSFNKNDINIQIIGNTQESKS